MSRTANSLVATLFVAGAASVWAAPEVITIKTLQAQMRYDVTDITVKPGAEVKLLIENTDDMPHNIVFFDQGTDVVDVCNKQLERSEEALKRNWVPNDPRMWLHSKMLDPKEKEELNFKAPDKPGVYPFVCSFPGHAATMQGKLRVALEGPKLTGLKYQMYLGDWQKLPDFASLKPFREGALPENLIDLKLDDYKNQFGVVYTAKLNAPKEGSYTFSMAADDGVRLLIDGKKIIEDDGIHPSNLREGKATLKAGEHDVRLEYFQGTGEAMVFLGWRGADFTDTALSKWVPQEWKENKGAKKKKTEEHLGIPLTVGNEPIVYRNFISGAGRRGIAVGYPGSASIAWSAESMNVALIWRGAFMDAARHWKDRGGGAQPPLGYDVLRPTGELSAPFAVLDGAKSEWPRVKKDQQLEGYQWRGYTLDAKRIPTFSYEWNGVKVTDRVDIDGDAAKGNGKVSRTLKLDGKIPANAFFRVATGKIQPADKSFAVDAGQFGFDGRDFENKFNVTVEGAKLEGNDLLVPARAEIKITYSWAHDHSQHAHSH